MADAAYRFNLENAWRQGHESADPNIARTARLSGNNHKPLDWGELTGQK